MASGSIAETACLITDLNMPGMSGLELQAYLRSAGHRTPIIIVTAYPTEEHRTRALKDRATSFLTKPLDERVLIGCLAHANRSPTLRPPIGHFGIFLRFVCRDTPVTNGAPGPVPSRLREAIKVENFS